MLVLSRRPGEETYSEHAGELLRVVVVDVNTDKARIGFDGPQSFRVVRDDAKRATPAGNEDKRAMTDGAQPQDAADAEVGDARADSR